MHLRPVAALLLACAGLWAQDPAQASPKVPWEKNIAADMKEGYAFLDEGKANEAAEKFQNAMKTDPLACWPYSGMASLYFMASEHTSQEHVAEYRAEAERWAFEALEHNDMDFTATRTLNALKGGQLDSHHQPRPEAKAFFDQAEQAFHDQHFKDSVSLYQKALDLDPAYTDAALFMGDAYYDMKDYEKAEPSFRKATELEPGYARAWRFLVDCLARMDRMKDAEKACFGAISAEPDDYTAWARLRQVREIQREAKLSRFVFPKVKDSTVKRGEDANHFTIDFTPTPVNRPEDKAAGAYNLIHGLGSALAMSPDPKTKARPKSAFEVERDAWAAALEALDTTAKEMKKEPTDPGWLQLRVIARAGQLDTALFLLRFREVFRPDFEAWKKAHPGEAETFIDKWQLRP